MRDVTVVLVLVDIGLTLTTLGVLMRLLASQHHETDERAWRERERKRYEWTHKAFGL